MESWSFNMSVRVSPVLGSNGTRCTFRMVNTGGNQITVMSLKLLNNMSGFIWIHCVLIHVCGRLVAPQNTRCVCQNVM